MTRNSKFNIEGWIYKDKCNGHGRRQAEKYFRFGAYSLENGDLWLAS